MPEMKVFDYLEHYLFEGADLAKLRRFDKYHHNNPHVFEEFKRIAYLEYGRRKKYGANAIVDTMRWSSGLVVFESDEFKISSGFPAIYARLLAITDFRFLVFFDFKPLKRAKGSFKRKLREEAEKERSQVRTIHYGGVPR